MGQRLSPRFRPGHGNPAPLLDYPHEIDRLDRLADLGNAVITDVGCENVYFEKDGREYFTKLLPTQYCSVGEVNLGVLADAELWRVLFVGGYTTLEAFVADHVAGLSVREREAVLQSMMNDAQADHTGMVIQMLGLDPEPPVSRTIATAICQALHGT